MNEQLEDLPSKLNQMAREYGHDVGNPGAARHPELTRIEYAKQLERAHRVGSRVGLEAAEWVIQNTFCTCKCLMRIRALVQGEGEK